MYRSMLRLLNEPRFIQLLVHPNNKYVAIRGVKFATPGDQTEKIRSRSLMGDSSYELYSKSFVEKLCQVAGNIDSNYSYRLQGCIVPTYNMAVFSLKTLKRIEV